MRYKISTIVLLLFTYSVQAHANNDLTVKMLDAGKGAKQLLRYTPKVGSIESATMTMTVNTTNKLNGKALPTAVTPSMVMVMRLEVTNVSPEGLISYRFKMVEGYAQKSEGIQEIVINAIDGALKHMVGMKGIAKITNRGINRGVTLEVPPNAPQNIQKIMDQLKKSMKNLASPLPEEPVGAGARWTINQKMNMNIMKITQTSTVTLKKLERNTITMGTTFNQSAKAQALKLPSLPPGMTARLKGLSSKGRGTATLNLSRVAPTRAEMKMTLKQRIALTKGKDTQNLETTITMDMGYKGQLGVSKPATKTKPADKAPGLPKELPRKSPKAKR